jgi:NADH-quinone oxidoreductase subunit N
MTIDYSDLISAAGSHLIVTFTALFVLLLDVSLWRDGDPLRRARITGALTSVGLVAALAYLAYQGMGTTGPAFYEDSAGVLVMDRLTIAMQALVLVLTLGTVLISIGWEQTRHVGEQLALVLFSAIGVMLLVATKNLLMFFVALELVSVTLYVLTGFHKGLRRSSEAALKYFLFGATSSAFLLFGLAWLMGGTGATDVDGLALKLHELAGPPQAIVWVGMAFMLVGLGFKIAAAPFHFWAPDAYEGAPTPVAAFIATASKVGSFVVALRLLLVGLGELSGSMSWPFAQVLAADVDAARSTVGWVPLVALLAVVSMVWGNFAAISQKNVKRLLAYSSVAHAGYMLIGFVANDENGIASVLFYLFAYGLTNLGAFGVIAALTRATGGDDLEDLDGLAQRSPLYGLLLLVFFLSLAGVPPLAGFFGKLYLFFAAAKADGASLGLLSLVAVALVTSAVSLYYYLNVLKHAFVHAPKTRAPVHVSFVWTGTLVVLALLVLGLGMFPEALLAFLKDALVSGRAFHV